MTTRRTVLKCGLMAGGYALATPYIVGRASAATSLRMQTFLGAGTPVTTGFEQFAADIAEKTGGEVAIETLPLGSVVPATDTVDAIRSGILDGQHTSPPYFAGKDPAFAVLGDTLSAYPDPDIRDRWFYDGGGLELARELYANHGLYYVGPVYWPAEWMPMRVSVNRLSDFEGLKIRMPEGLAGDLMKRVGVSIVTLPFPEVANALQTGVLDGADLAAMAINIGTGIHDVAEYSIFARHSMPTTEISVSLKKWEEISSAHQEIFEAGVKAFSESQKNVFLANEEKAIEQAEERGIKMIELPEEDRKRFRKLTVEVWSDWAAKSELSGRIIESHRAYMRDVGLL